jgi:hypothetical protein
MAASSANPDGESFLEAIAAGYPAGPGTLLLGAALRDGTVHADLPVHLALSLLNRHGLVAGATGTGKTRTLQGVAEKLSAAGVPVFLADLKGDLSGLAAPGEATDKVVERARACGTTFVPTAFPVEFLSLTGRHGAPVRATVADFGPLLLAKALDLNDTQASVLALVFKVADDQGLPLLDLADLRAVLSWLAGDDPPDLSDYGGLARSTAGVLARRLTELEAQGAARFFGEPAFDVKDLLRTTPDGRGVISILELADVQDRPRLFSTFLMWLLAELYEELPNAATRRSPGSSSSSTRPTSCSTTRRRRSRSRSPTWCASSARRGSASSSSPRRRRTSRPTCWASSATASSTRSAPTPPTTRRSSRRR